MALTRGLSVVCLLLLCGCFSFVTKEEGAKIQDQLNQLQGRSDKTEKRAAELAEQLGKQSEELRRIIDEGKRLNGNLADSAQKVDKLVMDMEQVRGRLDDLQKSAEALQKNFTDYRAQSDTKIEQLVNASTTAKNPPLPEDADGLYAEAQKRFDAKQWNDARRVYDAFLNRYGSDKRAPMAQFQIGEAYFTEGKFASAIRAFTKVIDTYPKSDEAESSMFKNGQAFFALKYCSDARTYFQELIKRYPRTKYKNDAGEQIKELTRKAKDKAACSQ